MTFNTTRNNKRNVTPDQSDYREHVLFDRSAGQKREKSVRRMRPHVFFSLFTANLLQRGLAR
ncbi:MAG TPA: hypothetical protein VK166_10145 [Chitinophagaceae bacterium]|nr:hypothetical protein [Chitinophagaceae bacterium]